MNQVRPSPLAPHSGGDIAHFDYHHQPVLKQEVLDFLQPRSGFVYIDATFGGGGHSRDILYASHPQSIVLGIDANYQAVTSGQRWSDEFNGRLLLVQDNFRNLTKIWSAANLSQPLGGILFDLGLSSAQLAEQQWGFSFQITAPLVMRYDGNTEADLTAATIINHWPQEKLEEILRQFGQEPLAGRIAAAIVHHRPLTTTTQLADLVVKVYRHRFGRSRRHPATRTFQALRIVVNDELGALKDALDQAQQLLPKDGRLVVISYHSLEDGLVKRFLKQSSLWQILTKKPVVPGSEELVSNPRSRSAKLRAAAHL